MNAASLQLAARQIVKRNVTANVAGAVIHWDADHAQLRLTYYCDDAPTESDKEWQELAMAELLAEFPDIATAECEAAVASEKVEIELEGIRIYERNAA